jgi:hypothetical protein
LSQHLHMRDKPDPITFSKDRYDYGNIITQVLREIEQSKDTCCPTVARCLGNIAAKRVDENCLIRQYLP